jgi:hypothetical protein
MLRKRPCRICGRWFYPDPRVGDRQRACSEPACQSTRRQQTQAHWRARNAEYFVARRIAERAGAAGSVALVEAERASSAAAPAEPITARMPKPLDRLPWDVAQDQFGVQGAEFLSALGRLLVRRAQDERTRQVADTS